MEGLKTEAAQSVTSVNPAERFRYETGKSGAWKTWHASPNDITKGGENKGGGYYGAYAPQTDCNKTSEI